MLTISLLFQGQAQVCFVLFASLRVLATLQNITVDDAVLVGPTVPTYLPAASSWNLEPGCPLCLVKPDPSYAYNGTWHDATFIPSSAVDQAIEFTFAGSGLYIFFILANTVAGATTLTNVSFILDGVQASTFVHVPSTSTDYEYNQTVYANDSIPYGQHTIQVVPANDSVDHVLVLFDYLIYTTDAGSIVTTSSTSDATTEHWSSGSPTVSSTPTSTPTKLSGRHTGVIVGGTLAGFGTLMVVTVWLLWNRRYKRRTGGRTSPTRMATLEPFTVARQALPTSPEGTSIPNQQAYVGSPDIKAGSRRNNPTLAFLQPSNPVSPLVTSPTNSTGTSANHAEIILEQVGQLRDEVARLRPSLSVVTSSANEVQILEQFGMLRDELARIRRIQDQGWNIAEVQSEPPPEYS